MQLRFKSAALFLMTMFVSFYSYAQEKEKKYSVSGTMGVSYEGYGLSRSPDGWNGYLPRRPWNQVRFNFTPSFSFGKDFKIPFNLNFATKATNFAGPYAGIIKQSFGQYITNPMNNFGVNPKYKWAELQLGTQYLKYSDLSTGDIGIFGAGVDLRPKIFRFKFFYGISQQGINYFSGPPSVTGAFKRKNWMFQLGAEKEGKYLFALNFAKGKDEPNSSSPPPVTVKPQEGIVMSLVGEYTTKGGWYIKTEGAESVFTKDLTTPFDTSKASFEPFLDAHTTTVKDYAAQGSVGKRSKNFDLGITAKYLGAGFQTTGYPYLQPDRFDYTVNTRINTWKNKMNIVASLGQRVNNVSNTALKAKQFIGNLNWFTQFDDHWSLNLNYNNFGFQSNSGINPYGIKNVSNDLGVNPTFNWTNSKMNHLVSLNYNFSKYDERDVISGATTSNKTNTVLVTYVPTYLTKELSPDFSFMYFNNNVPGLKMTLTTFSSGLSTAVAKKKVRLRGQLQFTIGKLDTFSSNKNFIASCNIDVKLHKKLTWTTYMSGNLFKYGNEIIPNGARYLESTIRTGLQYRFMAGVGNSKKPADKK